MRITRSPLFKLKQASKKSLFMTATSIFTLASLLISNAALQPAKLANAAATPESCFQFDSATGTILNYYNNEDNDMLNPSCPKDVEIPGTIGGIGVAVIGDAAFNSKQLSAVTIPGSVISIKDWAFGDNQLTELTIPSSVQAIGKGAFTTNKLSTVAISSPLTSIEDYTFQSNNLIDFSIPSTVTSIGFAAFANNSLASLQLPPSLTAIGGSAFSSNKITALIVPDSVAVVGNSSFSHNQISSLHIGSTVNEIGINAFMDNHLATLYIPNSVTSIGIGAFSENYLSTLTLSSSLTVINESTFSANRLTAVAIPASVTTIDPFAFSLQNPDGRDMLNDSQSSTYIQSSDPSVVQAAYDSIWYAQLYTSNPSNPNNLQSAMDHENWWRGGDGNANGKNDSLGGHIINPAAITQKFVSSSGVDLRPAVHRSGFLADGTGFADYSVKSGPVIPALEYLPDYSGFTAESIAAQQVAFEVYLRIGQSQSFTPPTIPGYVTPAPQTKTLAAGDNQVTFVYLTQAELDAQNTPPVTSVPFNQHAVIDSTLTGTTTPSAVTSPLITASSLSLTNKDGSAPTDCSTIQSARLLAPTTISSPAADVTLLGGLSFTLTCTPGSETKVSYALGATVSDTAKLRIYKHNTKTHYTEDITAKTTITMSNGKTVISYHLIDGGAMDEDGQVNGQIVDPIYVGLEKGAVELAETGERLYILAGVGATVFVVGLAAVIFVLRRKK